MMGRESLPVSADDVVEEAVQMFAPTARTGMTFLPLTVTDLADHPAEVPSFMPASVPVNVERFAPGIEVELDGGCWVRFDRDADPETMRRLICSTATAWMSAMNDDTCQLKGVKEA